MGFPDRIERVVELGRAPSAVWAALTTADGLSAWFGHDATVDLRPGGTVTMSWPGEGVAELRIERVEEPRVLGFTWRVDGVPADDPRRTHVEFTLEPAGEGTRLTVVETGFAQVPDGLHPRGLESHAQGWTRELAELVAHLDAA